VVGGRASRALASAARRCAARPAGVSMKKSPRTSTKKCRPTRRFRVEMLEERVLLDTSAAPILQYFEGSDGTIEKRAPDIFNAGYGEVLTPPPGRADSGNQSVGYDVYNRFDLGSPGNPTLYGTQAGLKAMIDAIHQTGASYYSDLVWNHAGFSNLGTPGFAAAGGYPGLAVTLPSDIDGDFHSAYDNTTTGMRLAGLDDIAQEKNYQFIRSPVDPSNPNNIPAGTTPAYGRLANVPTASNAQYYPDTSLQPISVYDPTTGEQNIKIYPFNLANPMHGTPVQENALGYLMRYTQWMVQTLGVDGFRLDAAKNMPPWVLNYYDRAVYRSSFRTLLNGSQENIFGFGEVFDGSDSLLQQYIRKDINPSQIGTIGGNRDVLDFPLYFAMSGNLSGNGFQNDWNNVINASIDVNDDGFANNGSQGVSFVSSADSGPPYLSNVAYAFTLTRPGNAIVYDNAQEFGTNRSFPQQGRGDALGGLYGNTITNLVNIRDTHPYGNFEIRDLEKETLICERSDSLLVGLSNRLDSGYDTRTVHTDFPPGTYLIELTGNATNPNIDPDNAIPPLLQVDSNGNVTMRVPRNRNDNNVETDDGYVIYAPATPQGSLALTNVDHVIPGQTPTAATNGTAVLANIDAITAATFNIQVNTNNVNLLGNPAFHDQNANGDFACFKIDGGVDVTGNGFVSTNPGDPSYGFQGFTTTNNPGYFSSNGNGLYAQTINTSKLSSGLHYIDVRVYRHRNGSEPAIWTDFKQAIYVDNGPAVTALISFLPTVAGVNENQTVTVQSTDGLANNIHVLWDLPASLTNAQVLALVSGANQANQIDRNLWTFNLKGVTSGNHVATVVAYQLDGSASVQRFPGLFASTIFGAGLGDLNFDGQYTPADMTAFDQVLLSNNSQFNPAADLNGDGLVNNSDLLQLYSRLQTVGAGAATLLAYNQILGLPLTGFHVNYGGPVTLTVIAPTGTLPTLTFSWLINNNGSFGDASGAAPTLTWSLLNFFGITAPGFYPIALRVGDGTTTEIFYTTLTVSEVASQLFLGNQNTTSLTAGDTVTFTITAQDAFHMVTGYRGTVRITSTDGQAMLNGVPLPTTYAFTSADNGVHTFTVTLKTAGSQTVTVTDQANGSLTATTSAIAVTPGPFLNTYAVTTNGPIFDAGSAFLAFVQAVDAYGNPVASYSGPSSVMLTSNPGDSQSNLPQTGPLNGNGFGILLVNFGTVGTYTLTAPAGGDSGTSGNVTIKPANAVHFKIAVPASVTTGVPFNVTVTALDFYNNIATGYTGGVSLSSSDVAATFAPNPYTFTAADAGVHTFSATLNSLGGQTISASDAANNINITSSSIATRGLTVQSVSVTPSGFSVAFDKPYDPSVLNLYDGGSNLLGPADVTITGAQTGLLNGSLFLASTSSITWTSTFGLLPDDTYTVVLRSGGNGFRDLAGVPLDGNNDGVAGDSYTTTFTTSYNATSVGLSVSSFARGPGQSVNLVVPFNDPTTYGGIPVQLSRGNHTSSATFTLTYNTTLLTLTGAVVDTGSALYADAPSGSTFARVLHMVSGGIATDVFAFNTNAHGDLGGGQSPVTLGELTASIPNTPGQMIYGSKELLHLSGLSVNGTLPAVPVDGFQVVAFPGDASGDGQFAGNDGSLVGRVAGGQDSGFAAYPLVDPLLIADVAAEGVVTANSASQVLQKAVHRVVPDIPDIPAGAQVASAGPDPTISLPVGLTAGPDGTIVVPVDLDDPHPAGSGGLTEATLALRFDPADFTVSASDIHLGSIPSGGSGWTLTSAVDSATGQLAITLYSLTPIATAQGGSLVTIDFHERGSATAGVTTIQLVPAVDPGGQGIYRTNVADEQGAMILGVSAADARIVVASGASQALSTPAPASATSASGAATGGEPSPVAEGTDHVTALRAASGSAHTAMESSAVDVTALLQLLETAIAFPVAGPVVGGPVVIVSGLAQHLADRGLGGVAAGPVDNSVGIAGADEEPALVDQLEVLSADDRPALAKGRSATVAPWPAVADVAAVSECFARAAAEEEAEAGERG
jgi:glycosidase